MLTRRYLIIGVPAALAFAPSSALPQPAGPISEDGFVPIGGIEQWVSLRGRDRSRPAILFLHGGPCDAQSPHLSAFAPWEKRYVVAQWDQRGTAKTFEKNGTATPNVTFEQIVRDAVEVAEYVIGQLGTRKLILVGHSWGALLGINVVRLRPDLFHAFIGTGQPVSGDDVVARMRSSALARAQAAGDMQAVKELKSVSTDELLGDMNTFVRLLAKWMAPFVPPDQSYIALPTAVANSFCFSKLMPSLATVDARSGGYELPIPYFVIQGRDDNRTLPGAAREFVEKVHAPAKGYVEIDGGHFACVTNPRGFLDALDNDLRRVWPVR
jgi:proline iminopeptidase